ncbi:NAD/NADP-dependent octopine/nopaline dehydrogenase family protein [Marinobacterium iners]|uniref:Opine dehydrogenase n=1 Tax=Marinobacterium iners DSM 11526 TaxID=1122198 RepID=A0A1H4FQF3_9GAMM|nr:NAD/NADP-dependent octopine/nopaline dehydrogenase family protein [Marinobacterium iners]SEA99589.1 opine dehydrogenase [Marinobacterium iners DSM 11526]
MEIAVLGGGHGCYAAAAELSEKGHQVRLWRRDAEALAPVIEAGSISLKDFRGERDVPIAKPTTSLEEAVAGAQLIVIPLPATTHSSLSKQLAPLLEDGQVLFFPPGTFASYIFAKAMREAGNKANAAFAETGTLPYLARKHGPRQVVCSGYATRLPTGVFPACNAKHAFEVLKQAYSSIEEVEDGLSGALMNAGGIIHPPLIMMNAGPLEHFDAWDIHNEGTQPAVRRVTDELDAERIRLREALNYSAPHFPLADHYAKEGDEWMYGRAAHERLTDSGDWREKIVLTEHRYMLEDTALGLSFLVSLGKWLNCPTPVAAGFLAIASAITGQDLYAQGRTLENLGLDQLSVDEMRNLLQNGV